MALSATQTKQSQGAVQTALRERQRKEELRRKQQEEKEAKEREIEKQRRLKMFEDQRKEEQRRLQLAAEERARELIMQRREEEQRNSLLYGPKKAAKMASTSSSSPEGGPKWPTSSSNARETVRKRRLPGASDDESGGLPLTREELRERKLAVERRKLYSSGKRSSHSGGYKKMGKRLPGGAVDIQTSAQVPEALAGKSVKDRLAAMPNTLTKLNTNKRDTRTIDEIVQDRARMKEGKTLQGDEALVFDDWFTTKKKEIPKRLVPARPSPPSALPSGSDTPGSSASMSAAAAHKNVPNAPRLKSVPPKTPAAALSSTSAANRSSHLSRSRPAPAPADRQSGNSKAPTSKPSKAAPANGKQATSSTFASTKKRPRSYSQPASPPPFKKRQLSDDEDNEYDERDSNLKSAIWEIFGKSRDKYVSKDVFSDDEDMEADATILEKEEARRFVATVVQGSRDPWLLTVVFFIVLKSPREKR
jgi:protein SPT2